jgi:hypothetical protein
MEEASSQMKELSVFEVAAEGGEDGSKASAVEGGNENGSKESKASATVSMNTLMPPTMTSQGLECSVHLCPKALRRELSRIFPDTEITDDFLAIPTAQHAKMDLVRVGEEVEDEKDALLINVRAPATIFPLRMTHFVCHLFCNEVHGVREAYLRGADCRGALG